MQKRFIFLAILIFMAVLFILGHPERGFTAYDGNLPANTTKIASAPAMIRENQRALKDDGIVNAGRVASDSIEDIRGVYLSCIASTPSTAILASNSASLQLGTATGTYHLIFEGAAVASETASNPGYGQTFTHIVGVRVGTTTEILGNARIYYPDPNIAGTALWRVNIATSATRGEITTTASGPIGAIWELWARKRASTW